MAAAVAHPTGQWWHLRPMDHGFEILPIIMAAPDRLGSVPRRCASPRKPEGAWPQ